MLVEPSPRHNMSLNHSISLARRSHTTLSTRFLNNMRGGKLRAVEEPLYADNVYNCTEGERHEGTCLGRAFSSAALPYYAIFLKYYSEPTESSSQAMVPEHEGDYNAGKGLPLPRPQLELE